MLHLEICAKLEKSEEIRQAQNKPKKDDADAAIASRSIGETQTLYILHLVFYIICKLFYF